MVEADLGDRQAHARAQYRAVGEAASAERGAHRDLDLALRGHADGLQELAHVHVEAVFVHLDPPLGLRFAAG